ncbi:MAG: HAMP domain-containing sensor histidine kinase [Bacteroidota bacterium]|nr:HAMP domain-containing sensor histidine kinase [Bacteroidota bacterium]
MSKLVLNKSSIRLLIIFTALSLMGLITTQVFWINNAIKLADQQFDNRVTIALQGALDEYVQIYQEDSEATTGGCLATCSLDDSIFINLLPETIDSLLLVHFDYHGLDLDYKFSVVKCSNGKILYSKGSIPGNQKRMSKHRISLSCLQHKESHHLEVAFGSKHGFILTETITWLIASALFLLIVVLSFAYIVLTIIRQKKIGEIRNDFINNMTHEFKTPLANISLASEVLMRNETKKSEQKIDQYAKIIYQENLRMKSQVERVLQVAVRNRDDLTVHPEQSDIHLLIKGAVDHVCLIDCHEGAEIEYFFEAKHSIIPVDPMHFTNIVHNLIDNAQKYSKGSPEIEIRTKTENNSIIIDFQDRGIGISIEAQKQIFEKFYRVPTGDIHNVKGFGLGLNYVKTMVEAQGGKISLKSEPGKGSCFTIVFPLP